MDLRHSSEARGSSLWLCPFGSPTGELKSVSNTHPRRACLNRKIAIAAVIILILVAIVRVVRTYRGNAQGFDEPCHVAAAIELLDKHTYTLDPVHPPLSRVAIGIPLYLAGERFPKWPPGDPRLLNYNDVGNSVLYDDGHTLRNLMLARSAIIPFFVLAAVLVFLWARREFGELTGLMAVFLFTTLPIILAFSGMAYTDIPTACMQFAAFFGFAIWLEKPTWRTSIWLGVVVGLALLTKMTTLLFFPAAVAGMFLCKWFLDGRQEPSAATRKSLAGLALACVIAIIVLWGGYAFSMGHVRESMQLSPDTMPSFQHFPGPVRSLARNMILQDWLVPAPALLKGLATIWSLNGVAPPAYLLGHMKSGGWWYFFLVGIAVKTPLPFLFLCLAGLIATLKSKTRWTSFLPAVCVFAILLVAMPVKYNAGVRHVMVVFPLLAVIAGAGAAWLWQLAGNRRVWGRLAAIVLLLWQVSSSLSAGTDFISYFNELAGRDPSMVLVAGCDLDCGQDLFRLSQALKERGISHFNIAIWSSADLSRTDLPAYSILLPFQPATGWIAISMRSLRFGDVFHSTYPTGAFSWLERYEPVAHVGKTVLLYHIPEEIDAKGDASSGQ